MSMTWVDRARAPGGLVFVQDLVNTTFEAGAYDPEHDQLASPTTARTWLRTALDTWAEATGTPTPLVTLRPDDLPLVQELRERLRTRLRADALNAPSAHSAASASMLAGDVHLQIGMDGRVRYQPRSTGSAAISELVVTEMLLAQVRGVWPNLKTCARPGCGGCFYDSSPNRSRVWHDTKTCGNTSNLRASRSRKRAT
jgi:predicted RNA-binding Zn ribbon-like protein